MQLVVIIVVVAAVLGCLLAYSMMTHRLAMVRGGSEKRSRLVVARIAAERVAAELEVAARMAATNRITRKKLSSENVVVDTLNLTHWLRRDAKRVKTLKIEDIIAAIETTAPIIRKRFPGRIIFVTKSRESKRAVPAKDRALYQEVSRRAGVYVDIVERIPNADTVRQRVIGAIRGCAPRKSARVVPHAALGRDDFYLAMIAWKLRCPVLSLDKFRDLADMKSGDLDSFQVYKYSPVRDMPERDFVNPTAVEFRKMGRPTTLTYGEVIPCL